jgi:hypothetical protein
MGWCGGRMGRGWQGHPGHVDPRAGRLGSEEDADDPGAGSRPWPVAADSALLAMGLTADKERTGGESLCAVAGRRFCVFPQRPTQLQGTEHNCRSQDAKEDDFSEMSAHRKLLLRIGCGHSRRLSA